MGLRNLYYNIMRSCDLETIAEVSSKGDVCLYCPKVGISVCCGAENDEKVSIFTLWGRCSERVKTFGEEIFQKFSKGKTCYFYFGD